MRKNERGKISEFEAIIDLCLIIKNVFYGSFKWGMPKFSLDKQRLTLTTPITITITVTTEAHQSLSDNNVNITLTTAAWYANDWTFQPIIRNTFLPSFYDDNNNEDNFPASIISTKRETRKGWGKKEFFVWLCAKIENFYLSICARA